MSGGSHASETSIWAAEMTFIMSLGLRLLLLQPLLELTGREEDTAKNPHSPSVASSVERVRFPWTVHLVWLLFQGLGLLQVNTFLNIWVVLSLVREEVFLYALNTTVI